MMQLMRSWAETLLPLAWFSRNSGIFPSELLRLENVIPCKVKPGTVWERIEKESYVLQMNPRQMSDKHI